MSCTVNDDLTVSLPSGDPDTKIKGSSLYFNVKLDGHESMVIEFNAPPEALQNFFNVSKPFTFAPGPNPPDWITNVTADPDGLHVSFTVNPVSSTSSAAFMINLNDGRAVDPTIVNDPPD